MSKPNVSTLMRDLMSAIAGCSDADHRKELLAQVLASLGHVPGNGATQDAHAQVVRANQIDHLWMHEDMAQDATEAVSSLPRKELRVAYIDARNDLAIWKRRALEAEAALYPATVPPLSKIDMPWGEMMQKLTDHIENDGAIPPIPWGTQGIALVRAAREMIADQARRTRSTKGHQPPDLMRLIERMHKHHCTTSLPAMIDNYGSREATVAEGQRLWREEVPALLLYSITAAPNRAPTSIDDADGSADGTSNRRKLKG